MRRFLSMLAVSIGMTSTIPLPAQALEIAVSPARFELNIDNKRKTQTLEIVNSSDREVTIGIDLANFDLDDNNQLRELPPTEQSLDQWIAINPTRVKIPANGRRLDNRGIAMDIQNVGNAHSRFKGIYAVWDVASYPGDAAAADLLRNIQDTRKASEDVVAPGALAAGVMSATPVLPGARRTIIQELPDTAKAGQRKVYLLGELGDAPVSGSYGL